MSQSWDLVKFFFNFVLNLQGNPYGLKEGGPPGTDMSAWTSAGLQPATGYYPYDPTLAAYGLVLFVV